MNEKWYKDLLVQKFQFDAFYDPTKLLIVCSLLNDGVAKKTYTLNEITTSIYRYYVANPDVARHNINIVIRNIHKYGISDIIPHTVAAINQWMREQTYGSFSFAGQVLYWNLESYDNDVVNRTKQLVNMLFQKYYKIKLNEWNDLTHVSYINDADIEAFGNCALKQRLLEEYQYCPFCEEIDISKLRVVHIVSSSEGITEEEARDSNNTLLMCKDAAMDYMNRLFYIDRFGRVHNTGSLLVSNNMRLGIKLLTNARKEYLERHSLTFRE